MAYQSIRDIIEIDEELCDGCGLCVPNCAEGALQVIDGKLRIADDARCDGAGACIGHCPRGALRVVQREAVAFDERYAATSEPTFVPAQPSAHKLAAPMLRTLGRVHQHEGHGGGCPGSRAMAWGQDAPAAGHQGATPAQPSALRQWPLQLHLLSPAAPFLRGREMLLAADCVAFAHGAFHATMLAGRSIAIACPKLDDPSGYLEKLTQILATCDVPAMRVAIMEVPCCAGLARLAEQAVADAAYEGEVEVIVVSRFGEIVERRGVQQARGAAKLAQNA
ncbi:MAG: 4Fe-4S binding protein [Polyangiaceae bacterium]|jgi:Fe-S-cluster-containing hydrogenase component 2|nr:4Fe-4S binding protein [Polyangiaceae bacterium]